jgi:hypothetical protein
MGRPPTIGVVRSVFEIGPDLSNPVRIHNELEASLRILPL